MSYWLCVIVNPVSYRGKDEILHFNHHLNWLESLRKNIKKIPFFQILTFSSTALYTTQIKRTRMKIFFFFFFFGVYHWTRFRLTLSCHFVQWREHEQNLMNMNKISKSHENVKKKGKPWKWTKSQKSHENEQNLKSHGHEQNLKSHENEQNLKKSWTWTKSQKVMDMNKISKSHGHEQNLKSHGHEQISKSWTWQISKVMDMNKISKSHGHEQNLKKSWTWTKSQKSWIWTKSKKVMKMNKTGKVMKMNKISKSHENEWKQGKLRKWTKSQKVMKINKNRESHEYEQNLKKSWKWIKQGKSWKWTKSQKVMKMSKISKVMKKARYTSPPGSRAVRSRPAVAPRWAAVPESGPNPRVASLPVRRWSRTCSGNVRRRRGRSSSAGAEPRERGGPVAVPVERWWSEERRLHALFLLVVQPYARQSAVVECLSPSDVLGALPWLERSRRLTEDPYNRNKGGGGGGGGRKKK